MKEKYISTDIDNIKILSCNLDDHVYIEGHYFNTNEEDCHDCVIILSRYTFLKTIDNIIERKKDYYMRTNGEFAGVGFICVDDYVELSKKEQKTLTYIEEGEGDDMDVIYKKVPTFLAIKVSVNIEHG